MTSLMFTVFTNFFSLFFFNDTATTEIYTLSLHDALPILDVANASIYDGASSVAEAVLMAHAATERTEVVVSHGVNPLYRRVTATYCEGPRMRLRDAGAPGGTTDLAAATRLCGPKTAALVVQSPNFYGCLEDIASAAEIAHAAGAGLLGVPDPVNLGG